MIRKLGFIGLMLLFSCNNDIKKIKPFTFNDLYIKDSIRVDIHKNIDDSIIEAIDKVKIDSFPFGYYAFYKNGIIKTYKFLTSNVTCRYSEEFDRKGNLIKREGLPLLNHCYRQINKDSVRYTFNFFALNKKYEGVEIITNREDTIKPILYDSKAYTNVKCTSFCLPTSKNFNDIEIYTKVNFLDTISHVRTAFIDTVNFKNVSLQ